MRVHFSSVATILVALLFVSGTVGCRSNGGAWYNPKSYTFSNPFANTTNPFAKSNLAPPYSPDAQANSKPSLGSHPNISTPPGGYSDGALASRAGSTSDGVSVSNSPPDHWGQPSPIAQQGSMNSHGGYSVAEPSQYSPYADNGKQGVAPTSYAPSQDPYQHQPEMVQHAAQPMSYSSDPLHSGYGYETTSAYSSQQPSGAVAVGTYGAYPGGQASNPYAPNGMPQNDPYASIQQPPVAMPQGYGYDQPAQPAYQGYPVEGVSAASPYQPYQPPAPGSGYNLGY